MTKVSIPPSEKAFFSKIRKEFPELCRKKSESPFVYLDSAASALKPRCVIDCLHQFYSNEYAPIGRSAYQAAVHATDRFEGVRLLLKGFLSAPSHEEIIFTKGTTDSINIGAELLQTILTPKSKILLSHMEHHSNIVPWQIACARTGAKIVPIPLLDQATLNLDVLEQELAKGNVTVVSICHASNILGTVNPIQKIAHMCHHYGALLFVDGAQTPTHFSLDLAALGCDFFAFSAHKMYGPNGVGILWGRKELLEKMKPLRGGGGATDMVTFDQTTYAPLPARLEPGTPAIAEVIAFGESVSFLQRIGMNRIRDWENALINHLRDNLKAIPGVHLVGPSHERAPLQAMFFEKHHPLDVASLLDARGIAVRTGQICGQPLLSTLQTSSVLRASCALYTTIEECDAFTNALEDVLKKLGA